MDKLYLDTLYDKCGYRLYVYSLFTVPFIAVQNPGNIWLRGIWLWRL